MNDKQSLLVKVSRPLGWVIAPLVFLMAFLYNQSDFSIIPIVQLILLSFPYCVFLYGINDIYDYKSDKINPRKKNLEGIKLSKDYHCFCRF